MQNFITLTCPSCGGELKITNEINRFACAHCGREHIVQREGGVICLHPVTQGIQEIRDSTYRVASELAINRLECEIHELQSRRDHTVRTHPGVIPISILLFLLSCVFLGFGFLSITMLMSEISLGIPIILLVIGVVFVIIGFRRVPRDKAAIHRSFMELNAKLDPLDKQLESLQRQLRKARSVVNNQ